LYHDIEGGAIAQNRQAPPGADLPYPNLADVPAPQAGAAPGSQAAIAARARGGVSAPSPQALAGLTLPAASPPLPNVPGLDLTNPTFAPAPPQPPVAPPAAAPPPAPPVSIAFRPGSALLPYSQAAAIQGVAAQSNGTRLRVCGFGEGSMALALDRAQRLADALTADGVPAQDIDINAVAAGSGGFVQPYRAGVAGR
jgi:outer membrane protein OmpA-like peptidoglycan-associated protein